MPTANGPTDPPDFPDDLYDYTALDAMHEHLERVLQREGGFCQSCKEELTIREFSNPTRMVRIEHLDREAGELCWSDPHDVPPMRYEHLDIRPADRPNDIGLTAPYVSVGERLERWFDDAAERNRARVDTLSWWSGPLALLLCLIFVGAVYGLVSLLAWAAGQLFGWS